ncbi:DNA polymerase III subunit gamma/tau [bacterium]|nr:MAG: DNA polymerase III subunit gamma/tau [bacterium]
MSYIVLALKWRPKNLDEIVGQSHIVSTLQNAIQGNRLAHAYIFSGPRGVGKTSTARILAKALNCVNGPTPSPCGKCPSCVSIAQGKSLDVLEIDGASNRGIDEIRELRESVKFAPAQGKYKVYIIDEVHQITSDGFNALLKTLEEPPEFVKFIFATTQPNKVPLTILSRCQRLDFRRISVMEIIAQLEKIMAAEKLKIDKDVLFAVAKSSDGSMRDAESILDQLIAFAKDKVSIKDITNMLGLVEQDALFNIAEKIISKDPRSALEIFNQIMEQGKDANVFLNNLIEHFRNLMVAKVAQADSELIDLPQDICERFSAQAQGISLHDIFSAFNVLVGAQEMSKRLDSVRIPLEIAIVRLAHDKKNPNFETAVAPKYTPPEEKPQIDKPKVEKPQVKDEEDIDPPQAPVEPETKNSVSLDAVKNVWNNAIENLTKIKMSLATYLNEGAIVSLEGNLLTVGFPKNYSLHKESLETNANKAIVEKVFLELLDARIKVNFILSDELERKDDAEKHAFVKSALDMFNARVVKEI